MSMDMSIVTVTWIALAVLVYFIGFIVTGVHQYGKCEMSFHPHECDHPYDSPLPFIWPVILVAVVPALAVVIALAPVVAPFWLSVKAIDRFGPKYQKAARARKAAAS